LNKQSGKAFAKRKCLFLWVKVMKYKMKFILKKILFLVKFKFKTEYISLKCYNFDRLYSWNL